MLKEALLTEAAILTLHCYTANGCTDIKGSGTSRSSYANAKESAANQSSCANAKEAVLTGAAALMLKETPLTKSSQTK